MNIQAQKNTLELEYQLLESELVKIARQESTGNWVAIPDLGDGETSDELDRADLTESYEERIAIVGVLEEQYIQVKKALDAIKVGTYGVCDVAGCIIAEKRLVVNPSATTCVEHTK